MLRPERDSDLLFHNAFQKINDSARVTGRCISER